VATNADTVAIRELVFSVLQEYSLSLDPQDTDRDLDDIEGNYHARNGHFVVVEDGGRIVACMGLFALDEYTCELRKMYTQPAVRGKGLGKQLMEHAVARARELGYSRMVLETATVLKEAISLYKKYGFREYRPAHLSCRCDQAFELDLSCSSSRSEPV